jgi:hypothetical protein
MPEIPVPYMLRGIINQFSGVHLIRQHVFPMHVREDGQIVENIQFDTGKWACAGALLPFGEGTDALDLTLRFKLTEGQSPETNVGVRLFFGEWSTENYVLLPAAVYNGNRFEARPMRYPPVLRDPADIGVDVPTIITDVPRLNNHAGLSTIQQLTRDLATPAVGVYMPRSGQGLCVLTEQATRLGDTGIDCWESNDRGMASISVLAPGVRVNERYTIGSMHHSCEDRGADFMSGDEVVLHIRIHSFACARLQDLFDRFVDIRKSLAGTIVVKHELPFSAAWKIQEEKYNRMNWDETLGYYAVGGRDDFLYSHWQIGWVGGLMSTYPMLMEGGALSRQRALRTFDFVMPAGQDRSGFFHGCGREGQWFGDNFDDIHKKWLLIRKNSDALYFLIKQYLLLQKQDAGWKLPATWAESTRRCADAFVRLWDRYGQFGQFVDTESGEIRVGGSASAGIAPAGLALAGQFFDNPDYLRVAQASGQYFYENFVKKGYTTGGPGEILQCPDSESAFGLLESLVVLYEVTGAEHWLEKAREQAHQCFTWCVSYDFQFPAASTFGRLDMRTTGSVYANVQNKHSAPGICTLSGDALFKLYRATDDERYLELIQEMAHNLPQYLSREDRPIGRMPAGWMNERVEMSDWLEPVGEIFDGSCWCEVSNMLAYMEVPGLYVRTDTGRAWAIDALDARVIENSAERLVVELSNPTRFDASVKVLAEDAAQMRVPLGQNALWGCRRVQVKAGERARVELMKATGP